MSELPSAEGNLKPKSDAISSAAKELASQVSDEPDPQTQVALQREEKAKGKSKTTPGEFMQDRLVQYHIDHCEQIKSLKSQIDRLQSRIDHTNSDVVQLHRRNAELEQAERSSIAGAGIASMTSTIGGGLLGYASFLADAAYQNGCITAGAALLTVSVMQTIGIRFYVWPSRSSAQTPMPQPQAIPIRVQ